MIVIIHVIVVQIVISVSWRPRSGPEESGKLPSAPQSKWLHPQGLFYLMLLFYTLWSTIFPRSLLVSSTKDGTWLEREEHKGLGKKWGVRRAEQWFSMRAMNRSDPSMAEAITWSQISPWTSQPAGQGMVRLSRYSQEILRNMGFAGKWWYTTHCASICGPPPRLGYISENSFGGRQKFFIIIEHFGQCWFRPCLQLSRQ